MLKAIRWMKLVNRQWDLSLALLYKIVHGHMEVPTDDLLKEADSWIRANHQYKYKQMTTSTTLYRNSFFLANVRDWNSCDEEFIESGIPDAFKQRLPNCKHQHIPTACIIAWNPSARYSWEVCRLSTQVKTRWLMPFRVCVVQQSAFTIWHWWLTLCGHSCDCMMCVWTTTEFKPFWSSQPSGCLDDA